jgi:serine/threonine-protein kinase
VLAYGHAHPGAYIAMELLEGESLEEVLDHGPLEPADAVRNLLPIVQALETAHAADIIHRDVKPANILVSRRSDGGLQPKLLDFGIASLRSTTQPQRLTVTGQVMGTPFYMSPEQAGGRDDVDHTCDLWGICAVLYELITGVGVFEGDNYNAVIRAVLMEAPQPMAESMAQSIAGQRQVDPELEGIVMRGLEKQRSRRWQSATELAQALSSWLRRQGYHTDVSGQLLRADAEPYAPRPLPPDGRSTELSLPTLVRAATIADDRPSWRRLARPGSMHVAALGVLLLMAAAYSAGQTTHIGHAAANLTWHATSSAHGALSPLLSPTPQSPTEEPVPARVASDTQPAARDGAPSDTFIAASTPDRRAAGSLTSGPLPIPLRPNF